GAGHHLRQQHPDSADVHERYGAARAGHPLGTSRGIDLALHGHLRRVQRARSRAAARIRPRAPPGHDRAFGRRGHGQPSPLRGRCRSRAAIGRAGVHHRPARSIVWHTAGERVRFRPAHARTDDRRPVVHRRQRGSVARDLHTDRRRDCFPIHDRLRVAKPDPGRLVAPDLGTRERPGRRRPHPRRLLRTTKESVTVPPGPVFIIGAGPGDPGLITARGLRLLAQADVVVYDTAVEPVLRLARPDAERIAAGAPAERDTAQDAISMLVAEKARDGHTVARLKWGDPFVFDSGAKEAMFLHEQGIPFEIVPGVPSAVGATAYAGIPATHPEAGDAFVLLRGHESEADEMPDVDWQALARMDGTISCHAGGRAIPTILQRLLDHGMSPDVPAAVVHHGTLPTQQTAAGTIGSLLAQLGSETAPEAGLLVVGRVVALRQHLRWFDERPLFGRRIVVTRSPEQAPELVERLEALGAQAILAPTFRIVPPEDPAAMD